MAQMNLVETLNRYYGGQLLDIAQRWTDAYKDFFIPAIYEKGLGVDGTSYTRYKTIPTVSAIQINAGIVPSYLQTEKITVQYGEVGTLSAIDLALWRQIPDEDKNEFRQKEDLAHSEAVALYTMNNFFYGSGSNGYPLGLANMAEYNDLNDAQVINAGSTEEEVYDIWIVNWSESKGACLYYPRGTTAGIVVQDLGIQTIPGSAGAVIPSVCTSITSKFAVGVPVPECVVRITNVDTTNVNEELLLIGLGALDKVGGGEISIFMNKTIFNALKQSVLTATTGRKSYVINISTDKTLGNDLLYFENERQRFRIINLPTIEPLTGGGGGGGE